MSKKALVLGAGGLVGAAYEAGVLAALEESLGWDARSADLIVGTSAGSQMGSSLRYGLSPADRYRWEVGEPLSPEGRTLFARLGEVPEFPVIARPRRPRGPSARLVGAALRHPWRSRTGMILAALPVGSISLESYADVFRKITGPDWCEAGLWIVGSKLPLAQRVVFGREGSPMCDVPLAVLASCAVPGIFAPVEIGGDLYVDGGVHSPTNADVLAGQGFDEVIVVSPMSSNRAALRTGRVSPMRLWARAKLAAEVKQLRKEGMRVTVFQPGAKEQRIMGLNGLDPERCPRVARAAFEAAVERIEKTKDRQAAETVAA